ncbi:MAG: hypothetical protein M1837_007012 [Sclerophora amabilis]|nr:MAG: hypothetical protein M1837_007012 [Sclerophora amabilis]
MASVTTHSSSSTGTTAPWKPLFLNHISKMPSPEFVVTTLHPSSWSGGSSGSSSSAGAAQAPAPAAPPGVPYVPRARYCIYRGMWAELPENKHNTAPRNERVFESELPTFTSDVRMEKVPEVFASSAGHGKPAQSRGSGGGGPVEAVWWVKEVMTQWRVRGEAFIVGQDIEGGGSGGGHGHGGGAAGDDTSSGSSSGVRTVKSEVGKRMRVIREGGEKEWSWETEVTAHFGNLSPGMRGSFKNPPPGTPVSEPLSSSDLSLGQKITDLHDTLARENFRVVIIRPQVVEQLDLSDPATARRWRFTFVGEESNQTAAAGGVGGLTLGEWKKEELWP